MEVSLTSALTPPKPNLAREIIELGARDCIACDPLHFLAAIESRSALRTEVIECARSLMPRGYRPALVTVVSHPQLKYAFRVATSARDVIEAARSIGAATSREPDGLPDRGNLYATLDTDLRREEVAALFAASGWDTRKCGSAEHEFKCRFAELVLEAERPLLLHGVVADVLANAPRVAEVLRNAEIRFVIEC